MRPVSSSSTRRRTSHGSSWKRCACLPTWKPPRASWYRSFSRTARVRREATSPDLRRLRQRIALWARTHAITPEKTSSYITQRLLIAGASDLIFPEDAVAATSAQPGDSSHHQSHMRAIPYHDLRGTTAPGPCRPGPSCGARPGPGTDALDGLLRAQRTSLKPNPSFADAPAMERRRGQEMSRIYEALHQAELTPPSAQPSNLLPAATRRRNCVTEPTRSPCRTRACCARRDSRCRPGRAGHRVEAPPVPRTVAPTPSPQPLPATIRRPAPYTCIHCRTTTSS